MARNRKGAAPTSNASPSPAPIENTSGYPILCLRHLQAGWGIEELDGEQCRQFLLKWAKRSRHTWVELVHHRKHGLGHEFIPASSIRPSAPESLAADRYLVFRHQHNLPFAGFRSGDTFHVLWIEKSYNELYNHGS